MVVKQRSPNYPAIGLNEAVELVKKAYSKVGRGEFSPLDAAGSWGYGSVSGPVRRKFGALRQYGLVDQKKGDTARVSNRGLTLILRNPASNEYRAALKEAALEPPLFRELHENGKSQAADDALRQYLIVERGFTDDGAQQFINVLRATITVAGLAEESKIASQDDGTESEQPDDKDDAMTTDLLKPPAGKFVMSLAGGSASVRLEFPLPLTDAMWKQVTGILDAIKSQVVAQESESDQPSRGI